MSLESAQQAWRDWLKSERRLASHTLIAYEHDVSNFLGFMTSYLGSTPTLEALAEVLHRGWPEGLKAAPPQRHGPRAARAVRVDEKDTLGEVLGREDFVVPGIPAFFVLSRSKRGRAAEVRRRFLEENE